MTSVSERSLATRTPFQLGREILVQLHDLLEAGESGMIAAAPEGIACAFRIPADLAAKIGQGLTQVKLRSSKDRSQQVAIIVTAAAADQTSVYRALYTTFQVVMCQAPDSAAIMNEAILKALEEEEAEYVRNLLLKPTGYSPETDPREMQVILGRHWQELGEERDTLAGFAPENLTRCL